MDSARSQPGLGQRGALTRYPGCSPPVRARSQSDIGVPTGSSMRKAEDGKPPGVETPGVSRGINTGLSRRRGSAGVRHAHHDQQLARAAQRAGDPPLTAGDGVVPAISDDGRCRLAGLEERPGARYAVGRADLPREQWVQPPLLLVGSAEEGQQLHVAGVGWIAVERFRRYLRTPSGDSGQRCVLNIDIRRRRVCGRNRFQRPLAFASAFSSVMTAGLSHWRSPAEKLSWKNVRREKSISRETP